MATIGGWLGPDPLADFIPKICGLILCADPGGGGGGGGAGDICDLCLGGGGRGLDLDLFDHFQHFPGGYTPPQGVTPVPRCDEWESVGPVNAAGRMTALAVHPTTPSVVYAGSAAGGVFKSTDGGSTWIAPWQDQLSLALRALAIAPRDPQVVYASTGEWTRARPAPNNHLPGGGR